MQLLIKERENKENLELITITKFNEPVMSFVVSLQRDHGAFLATPITIVAEDAEALPMFNYVFRLKRQGYVKLFMADNATINGKKFQGLSLTVYEYDHKLIGICHGSAEQALSLGFRCKQIIQIP